MVSYKKHLQLKDSVSFWSSKGAKSSRNILKTNWFLYDACLIVWTSNIQNLLTCIFWQLLATFAKYQWLLYNACSLPIKQASYRYHWLLVKTQWILYDAYFIHLFTATYRIYLYSTEKKPKFSTWNSLYFYPFVNITM